MYSQLRQRWHALIRFGFRLLYNELAWTYGAVSWVVSLGQWRAWGRAALSFVQGRSILEIAHGPGHLLLELGRTDRQIVGLDLSPYMGRQARRRLARASVAVPLVRGRAEALPFADGSFDTVVTTFPTDFFFQPATLAAVGRVLRDNGRYLIVPSGYLNGRTPLHRFIDWLYQITGQRAGSFAIDGAPGGSRPDPDLFTRLKSRFDAAGFDMRLEHVRLTGGGAVVLIALKRSDPPA